MLIEEKQKQCKLNESKPSNKFIRVDTLSNGEVDPFQIKGKETVLYIAKN